MRINAHWTICDSERGQVGHAVLCAPALRVRHGAHRTARPTRACIWLLVVCFGFNSNGFASEKPPAGREVFRQQCVKCHGRNGEGVKGKYDSALHGDWSLEKLTRYIDKNMPDDAPETCVGPQAAAVARYIYDAFYSREARLRNHPPRIELVHLTNRQYVNTVADLLKQFTGADAPPGNEHGLRAHYRSNFRKS